MLYIRMVFDIYVVNSWCDRYFVRRKNNHSMSRHIHRDLTLSSEELDEYVNTSNI